MDCSLSGSFAHGIRQARILECIAIPLSRGSSQPRDQTRVVCIAGRFFTVWASREAPLQIKCGWNVMNSVWPLMTAKDYLCVCLHACVCLCVCIFFCSYAWPLRVVNGDVMVKDIFSQHSRKHLTSFEWLKHRPLFLSELDVWQERV